MNDRGRSTTPPLFANLRALRGSPLGRIGIPEPLRIAQLHERVGLDYDRLKFLEGRSVLVRPEIFDSQNSVGRRGSLHVVEDPAQPGRFRLEIQMDYPEMSDMAGARAHTERLLVAPGEVEALLQTEFNGAFTYTERRPDGPTKTVA